jgi:hypothetical protein
MKIEKFQLRGNSSLCAGAFPLLRGRAPAKLRGNAACECCVLSGRGLCVGLISRPEDACQMHCV